VAPRALGASDLTLLEHTSAFTTFPDDGVHIAPRMIQRVTNYDGRVIDDFPPEVTDVLPAPIARLELSMLREVINSGTAVRAKAMKRPIAGKTGTTNEFSDAWFMGFSPSITTGVWVGFDDHRSLGPKEEGAKVALPIWMNFMSEVLKDKPAEDFPHSPLLTNPDQVKEILDGGGTERLLAEHTPASREAAEPSEELPPPAKAEVQKSIRPVSRVVSGQTETEKSAATPPKEDPNQPATRPPKALPVREVAPPLAKPASAQGDSKPVPKEPSDEIKR